MTKQFTEESICTDSFSLHTTPLVMLRENFLREGPKRLILANHLGDIRLHKQRESLPRHALHSWSRADSDTVRSRTEPARSGDLQCLPRLKREAVRWDRNLYELPPARLDIQTGCRRRRLDWYDVPIQVMRQVDCRTQSCQTANPVRCSE